MNKSPIIAVMLASACGAPVEQGEVVYGELEQPLTWPVGYGNDPIKQPHGHDTRCDSNSEFCIVPGARNLTLQTCTPPGYSTAWKTHLNNEATSWAEYISDIQDADYTITLDLNNCIQDHRVYKIFLTYGDLPGQLLGRYDHGLTGTPFSSKFLSPTQNTVTIDDAYMWDIKTNNGRDMGEYWTKLGNTVWHELGHAMGLGHSPTAQAPASSSSYFCMRQRLVNYDAEWQKLCEYDTTEIWMLETFHW